VGHDRAGSLRGTIEFTDIPFKEVLWILDKLESAHSCQQMTAIWSCDDESSTGAQQPHPAGQGGLGLGEVLDDFPSVDGIECGSRKWRLLRGSDNGLDALPAKVLYCMRIPVAGMEVERPGSSHRHQGVAAADIADAAGHASQEAAALTDTRHVVRTEKAVRPRSVCHLLMSWATVMALEDTFVRRDQFKDHAVDRQAQTRSRNAAFNPVAFYRSLTFNAAEPRVQVVDRQLGGRLDLIPPQAGLVAVPQHDL
jgi:hypothetical protein